MNKKVLVFGGGTGITYLLSGLKLFPLDITAVITVADNGSSTGKLREEFTMPAMGDLRKVIVSLSDAPDEIKNLFEYRFNTYSDLNGHPIGNLILVGMYNMTGSMKESIITLSKFLNVKHKVFPISEDNLTLVGETMDGEIIKGEEQITNALKKFKKLYYENEINILEEVIKEIENADIIIFSMGSLYTSIIPNIISKKVIESIDKSKAKLIYTCNAVTQPGETDNYTVGDHIKLINKYLGNKKLDLVIASNTKIPRKILNKYETKEQKDIVKIDEECIKEVGCRLVASDLLTIDNNTIRHNSLKLGNLIFNYMME